MALHAHHTHRSLPSQHSAYETTEDENDESEEQEHQDEDYEEVPGEFEDEYEHEEEHWYIETPGQSKRSFSTRSSIANSQASMESRHRFMRKSIKKSIIGALVSDEDDVDYNDDQDLADSLPDDIAIALLEYWQQMDDAYLPLEENSLQFITKTHKKLINYPSTFEEEFLKQLDEPDKRAEIAEGFKADFNRLPVATRITDQTKIILNTRIGELTVKLEGITEEKFAKSKRTAYKILSKGSLTRDSEKLAKLFGIILQAETDRFADTIKFINEHYYKTIAMDLGMPNKVRWKEIIDIGLIKKKFICQHYVEKCSLRDENESDSWKKSENEEKQSSSDSDICGGGYRGEDLAMVCEDDEESTPTEELSINSLFNLNGGEDEEMDFGESSKTKMNGEMKISLEFDNEEFLGEGGWDPYVPQLRVSEESEGTGERLNESRNKNTPEETAESPEGRESQSALPEPSKKDILKDEGTLTNAKTENILALPKVPSQGKSTKSKSRHTKSVRKSKSEKSRKKSKKSSKANEKTESEKEYEEEEEEEDEQEEYSEEYTEELDMEEVEVINPEYYEDEEYPGEFWEGEGYGAGRYSTGQKRESVKFDDNKSYIRDFFYDSDPSKQTDKSKVDQGAVECKDEGYFDEDEIFDDEDVFYDREEFFERDWDVKKTKRQCAPEPQYLHFAIFGREDEKSERGGMSLMQRLLMKWTVQPESVETLKEKIESNEEKIESNEEEIESNEELESKEESAENEIFEVEEDQEEEGEGDGEEEEEEEEGEYDEEGEGEDEEGTEEGNSETKLFEKRKSSSSNERLSPPSPHETKTIFEKSTALIGGGDAHTHIHPSIMEFSDDLNLLKLHPNLNDEKSEHEDHDTSKRETVRIAQKRPLLEIFVSLQDEIWSGFEIAFREAKTNIDKVTKSLKQVVQSSHPKDEPRDPCEEEVDLHELISRGEAIKAKYKSHSKPPVAAKVQKRVHLKESIDGDEDEISNEVEMESSPDQEEENEEEEDLEGSRKSSAADVLTLHQQQTSKTSGNEEMENVDSTNAGQERKSSLAGSETRSERTKKKRVSIEDGKTKGKKPVLERGETSTTSNPEKKISGEDSGTSANEEKGEESERKNSNVDSQLEEGSSDVIVDSNSPQSDHRTESSERTKSAYLERTAGETDIRLPDSPEPSPEEKKILKKAKHALLKSKLLNWEKTLEVEAERLARQLAFIEYHAQTQFSLLKHLPANVWEKSKTQATNVYMEELKRDVEIGEVFKIAAQNGSRLYGKFYVDRYDLKLLLNDEPPPIPLKYTDEFHSEESQSPESRKSKRVQHFDYEE